MPYRDNSRRREPGDSRFDAARAAAWPRIACPRGAGGDDSLRSRAEAVRLTGRFRQGDRANLLGATTRSIITILNDWRGRGVLAYDAERGFITVIDEAFFRRLVAPGEDEEPVPTRP